MNSRSMRKRGNRKNNMKSKNAAARRPKNNNVAELLETLRKQINEIRNYRIATETGPDGSQPEQVTQRLNAGMNKQYSTAISGAGTAEGGTGKRQHGLFSSNVSDLMKQAGILNYSMGQMEEKAKREVGTTVSPQETNAQKGLKQVLKKEDLEEVRSEIQQVREKLENQSNQIATILGNLESKSNKSS